MGAADTKRWLYWVFRLITHDDGLVGGFFCLFAALSGVVVNRVLLDAQMWFGAAQRGVCEWINLNRNWSHQIQRARSPIIHRAIARYIGRGATSDERWKNSRRKSTGKINVSIILVFIIVATWLEEVQVARLVVGIKSNHRPSLNVYWGHFTSSRTARMRIWSKALRRN